MVKEIIKDEFFLKQKSKSCTKEDLYIANELLETISLQRTMCWYGSEYDWIFKNNDGCFR